MQNILDSKTQKSFLFLKQIQTFNYGAKEKVKIEN